MAAGLPGPQLSPPRGAAGSLVLLHGAGGRGQLWQHQLLAFPQAVAPDLPGRAGDAPRTTVAELAAWIGAYLDARAPDRIVLGGHSLGAAVALQVALDAPARLRGLILVGAGARLRVRPEFFELLRADPRSGVEEFLRWWFSPAASPRVVARARAALRDVPAAVLEADLRAADGFDVRARLAEIALPTLILCGEEDRLTPLEYSEYLRAHLSAAQLVVVPRAGHLVMLEQPRLVNEAIGGFLRRLEDG
ncbi:MAG TPA: alpha/beta fold hydrolase [bacterium]|nr:alpha/beta fold hydrolase [bacterium]